MPVRGPDKCAEHASPPPRSCRPYAAHTVFSALRRLFTRGYEPVANLAALAVGARIEIVGDADPVEELRDPVTGELAVAVRYSATIPGAASRVGAGLLGDMLDGNMQASEAVDFVLVHPTGRALVVVQNHGPSVHVVHDHLVEQHGLDLRPDSIVVSPRARVCVRGTVVSRTEGSPHRGADYAVVIRADEFLPVNE